MSSRTCQTCGTLLPLQTGRGGRRKRCEKCSPTRRRTRATVTPITTRSDATPAATVTDATRAELDSAGVLNSSIGQLALVLAARIDSGQESGSALAALVKCLRDTMAAAMAEPAGNTDPEPDIFDQVRARMRAREQDAATRARRDLDA